MTHLASYWKEPEDILSAHKSFWIFMNVSLSWRRRSKSCSKVPVWEQVQHTPRQLESDTFVQVSPFLQDPVRPLDTYGKSISSLISLVQVAPSSENFFHAVSSQFKVTVPQSLSLIQWTFDTCAIKGEHFHCLRLYRNEISRQDSE